jgi:hypothetical protein
MTHLEIALLVATMLLVVLVGLLVDRVIHERDRARRADAARAQAQAERDAAFRRLQAAKGEVAALSRDLAAAQQRHAKAEHDLGIACALRPLSIQVPQIRSG